MQRAICEYRRRQRVRLTKIARPNLVYFVHLYTGSECVALEWSTTGVVTSRRTLTPIPMDRFLFRLGGPGVRVLTDDGPICFIVPPLDCRGLFRFQIFVDGS